MAANEAIQVVPLPDVESVLTKKAKEYHLDELLSKKIRSKEELGFA